MTGCATTPLRPFDHVVRGRFNAWFFSALDRHTAAAV